MASLLQPHISKSIGSNVVNPAAAGQAVGMWRYRKLARNGVVGNRSLPCHQGVTDSRREQPSHWQFSSEVPPRAYFSAWVGSGRRELASASSVKHPGCPSNPLRCAPNGIIMADPERWQSGRSHPPRKRAYLNGYREFESPPLRQPPALTL